MKEVNICIPFGGLLTEKEKEANSPERQGELTRTLFERVLTSSMKEVPRSEQRRLDRILDAAEDALENDLPMKLRDKDYSFMLELWEKSKLPPATGGARKILREMDKRLCPDEYEDENENAD